MAFDPLKDINDFHHKFGLAYDGPPRQLDSKVESFRFHFMHEELTEYITEEGLEQKLDALVDLMYVLLGTAYMHGFHQFPEAWRRVHEANMKKVRATSVDESKRNNILDVVKPKDWTPPSLSDLV